MHWSGGHSSVHVCTLGAPLGLRGTTVGARFSLSRVPRRVTHCLACNSAKAMDASMFRLHSYSRPHHYLLHTPSHTPSHSLYRTLLTTWKQLTRGAVGTTGIPTYDSSLPLYFKRARWTSRQSSRPPVCTVHSAAPPCPTRIGSSSHSYLKPQAASNRCGPARMRMRLRQGWRWIHLDLDSLGRVD